MNYEMQYTMSGGTKIVPPYRAYLSSQTREEWPLIVVSLKSGNIEYVFEFVISSKLLIKHNVPNRSEFTRDSWLAQW